MPRTDLISFTELAGECGVSHVAVSKFVRRRGLASLPLPHSAVGRALAPEEAQVVRDYYEAKRKNNGQPPKCRLRLVSA
jgi:DNA-binding MurR/RpiR family transcriptional regulator